MLSPIHCETNSCRDIAGDCRMMPPPVNEPGRIRLAMIAEAPPQNKADYFYAAGLPFYLQTTLKAFHDADVNVSNIQDILTMGIYITTAVKCAKTGYAVSLDTIKNCSRLLEDELKIFPNIQVIMLMGDVAIKSFNLIAKKTIGKPVIPSGSTYKIREQPYYYENIRVFPSYLQTGKNFLIEKSKQKMIADDIREAIEIIKNESVDEVFH